MRVTPSRPRARGVEGFSLDRARELAVRRFGLRSLHREQEQAIGAVAKGQDVLVVLPTGSGKSLCYQLPAMLFDRPSVVVSPLLALIRDQHSKLQRLRLPVSRLDSTVPAAERRNALEMIANGGPRVVLTTPETLESEPLVDALQCSGVALLAVDEAHCISEWGHDFRPAYLRLPASIERLRPRSLMALTATATARVREEINRALGMEASELVVAPPHRHNLLLSVEHWIGTQKLPRLAKLIRSLPRPGIIYCATVDSVDRIGAALRAADIPSAQYHGRMKTAAREEAQQLFMSPERRIVMIATSAFGMGIDKPNIRYIVHYHATGSLEQYLQEAGRAGRDGRRSHCILQYDPDDLAIQARLAAQGRPSPQALARLASALIEWSGEKDGVDASSLALSAQVTAASARALLGLLDERGITTRRGARYKLAVSPDEFLALSRDLAGRFDTLRREDERRLAAVEQYASSDACRSVFLRAYFGEEAPPRCGQCDRCAPRERESLAVPRRQARRPAQRAGTATHPKHPPGNRGGRDRRRRRSRRRRPPTAAPDGGV